MKAQKNSLEKYVEDFIQLTAHQMLSTVENAVGLEENKSEVVELDTYRNRLHLIFQQILKGYIYHYGSKIREGGLEALKLGNEAILPLYVSLKATIIISKEIILEFLESRFADMKLNY